MLWRVVGSELGVLVHIVLPMWVLPSLALAAATLAVALAAVPRIHARHLSTTARLTSAHRQPVAIRDSNRPTFR